MRGEYSNTRPKKTVGTELPPRARRILVFACFLPQCLGTTSACAENTVLVPHRTEACWNYLRVRGEYWLWYSVPTDTIELPPRARRIREVTAEASVYLGTTSACAENTHRRLAPAPPHRNYLRVRGEYLARPFVAVEYEELPPRARRILLMVSSRVVLIGTTSACAENTWLRKLSGPHTRNYLRVRGEYRPRLQA